MRILFVGDLWQGSTTSQRLRALQELGHSVRGLDATPPDAALPVGRWLDRVFHRLFRMGLSLSPRLDLARSNQAVLERLHEPWDILWLDKALTIAPSTLAQVKKQLSRCVIVGYSPDDMAARHSQSRQFLNSLPYYDIFFTTKSYGVRELRNLGCPSVEFMPNGYDSNTHRPYVLAPSDRREFGGPVGFVGAYEPARANSMYALARAGIPVRIWGESWERCSLSHQNLRMERTPLWGEHYGKALCSFDIALCFLCKLNRDLQTQRSVEIPACGVFMLAERTTEHLGLFEEGKEAEFFDSDEELVDKTRYYVSHPNERARIASAGRQRCLTSGYSYQHRLRRALDLVMQMRKEI